MSAKLDPDSIIFKLSRQVNVPRGIMEDWCKERELTPEFLASAPNMFTLTWLITKCYLSDPPAITPL